MGLFNRKTGEDKRKKQRETILRDLKNASADGDQIRIYAQLMNLNSNRLLDGDEVPYVINGVIEAAARRNFDEGLGMAIYTLNTLADPQLTPVLVDKTLSLISRADRKNMKQMASVCMAAGLVTQSVVQHSPEHARALKEWNSAIDILAAQKSGLQYAFAAASNAVLADGYPGPLQRAALDKWEKIVTTLAQSDRKAAFNEISRVARGYHDFGYRAQDFHDRAIKVLENIVKPKR